nr:type II toxin-antitoxin system HicA family toxin [Peptoanaerobacter stomatis]
MKNFLKMFLRNGWEIRRIKGSHHHLFKDGKRETIAVHSDEINPNLAKKIIEKHNLK